MEFKTLNRDNFMLYCIGNYTNTDCMGMAEFTEDLARIKYIKRLLKRYGRTGNIRIILLLNHLMVLGNVFGRTPASRMLFYKLDSSVHSLLKTVLLYLDYIDEHSVFDGLITENIPIDNRFAKILRDLT